MKSKFPVISRLLLALFVLIFGLNKFFHFLPMPPPPEDGAKYLTALGEAGFIFPTLGSLFILSGTLLILGRATGFSLVILAPLAINAVLYHLQYDISGIGPSAIFGVLIAVCAWCHRDRFQNLFV